MTITTEQLEARATALGLDFFIEDRSGIPVKQWIPESNGCTPATAAEVEMWELLAALEAAPVNVTDRMALDFHHALTDGSIGNDELEEIKTGLRAALCNVTAPPAPAVPREIPLTSPVAAEYVAGWNACRAAMLKGERP